MLFRSLKYGGDKLRSERNKISKKINDLKKKGEKFLTELKIAKGIPIKLKEIEEKDKKLQKKIREIMFKIPNIMDSSVPIGKDESENVEIEKFGKPIIPDYEIFNHSELAEELGVVDFDSAREVSGKGFYYLLGDLALLHSSMLAFARDYLIKKGFEYTIPPFMIRRNVVEGVMSFEEIEDRKSVV